MTDDRRLSKEQSRVLERATHLGEPLAVSGATLMELAGLAQAGRARLPVGVETIYRELENEAAVRILPITLEIAREVVSLLAVLRDPVDAVLAATARVHGLRLVTSDERIQAANVVSTVG